MNKQNVIFCFVLAMLLTAASCGPVEIGRPSPSDDTASPIPAETGTTDTAWEPQTTSIPSPENTDVLEPSATSQAESPTPELTAATTNTPEPTQVPGPKDPQCATDYSCWINWRKNNPDEYEAWKALPISIKESYGSDGKPASESLILPEVDYSSRYRISSLGLFLTQANYKGNGFSYDEYLVNPSCLPLAYYEIKKLGIPKEELLEYIRWQNWSDSFEKTILSERDIEVLYSDDEDLIRRHFMAEYPASVQDGHELYSSFEILYLVQSYDIGRLFDRESLDEYVGRTVAGYENLPPERVETLMRSWDEYRRILERDAGSLSMETAAETLSKLLNIYKEIRYSPEVLGGEPVWTCDPDYFLTAGNIPGDDGKNYCFSNKPFAGIREELYSFLAPELLGQRGYNSGDNRQFTRFEFIRDQDVVSVNTKFYNGPIELFGDDYKLEEHIRIVSGDQEKAEAILTAKDRSGNGELTFSVQFEKIGGMWRISGGTVLELISPYEG